MAIPTDPKSMSRFIREVEASRKYANEAADMIDEALMRAFPRTLGIAAARETIRTGVTMIRWRPEDGKPEVIPVEALMRQTTELAPLDPPMTEAEEKALTDHWRRYIDDLFARTVVAPSPIDPDLDRRMAKAGMRLIKPLPPSDCKACGGTRRQGVFACFACCGA